MPSSSRLSRAESWAASLWETARGRWSGREDQDRNFRLHVVHPAVRSVLRKHFPEGGVRVLDLGCGDGALLADPENRELLRSGSYLGTRFHS
jgi:2-polyprenyl-3-methyl-5-hydroxy-6-metoxy-1,4-benzoquinol methylase